MAIWYFDSFHVRYTGKGGALWIKKVFLWRCIQKHIWDKM